MNKITRKLVTLVLGLCATFAFAQQGDWTSLSQRTSLENVSFRQDHMPTQYQLFALDFKALNKKLANAPKRGNGQLTAKSPPNIINVPTADGRVENFRVIDAHIMHDDLQAKFPNIRSYVGHSLDNPGSYIRFSVSKRKGFHAQIFEAGKETRYIDPYTEDASVYMSYSRKDLVNTSVGQFSCETDNAFQEPIKGAYPTNNLRATDDGIIRVYELALSCTGEYSNFHSNVEDDDATRTEDVMAEMVVAMTRVNGIYEKEMGITFEMIANNDVLIYLDPETDPWDDEYNDTTQEVIDEVIGDAGYDIGHNFNTSGGGNAGCIGCVCNSGNKGSGFTGLPSPEGDPFYVDFVAHEMGHQIGGYHTHNGTGTCLKSGNNTEVEPGSGSTIMGYAGICPGQDIQNQSDDYFNYVNIRDISANIQNGVSSSCFDAITDIGNSAPTADAGPDYTIPIGTAFQLRGTGTDADATDVLTYTWEQNDNEDMQTPLQPVPTATAGPMFRSRRGTTTPDRYFPQLSDILENDLMPRWEVISLISRDFEFAFTVRDNVVYGGQTQDDLMTLSSTVLAGPFMVTSQNGNTTWIQGETETINWDVAGTNLVPVNSLIVDILFSAAGDFSDTQILANDVVNSGSADIIVPPVLTETGRLMVKAADNVFLDVNDATISIEEATTPTFFLLAQELSKTECASEGSETFDFEYTPTTGFVETVTFSATGFPTGTTATFSPETGGAEAATVTMTINDLNNAPSGDYTIIAQGASASKTKTENVMLTVKGSDFETPSLMTPENASMDNSTFPTFGWSEDSTGATEAYDIEISDNDAFTSLIETATVASNSYTASVGLQEGTVYFWRLRPSNECAQGEFTSANSFTTGTSSCATETNNTPTAIISTFTMTSTITIDENVALSDINVSADITHPYIGDVVLELISPQGTAVTILASRCDSEANLEATFDDAGEALVCSTDSPAISGTITPQQQLSAFNGESSEGTWELNITDTGIGDDGTLNSWSIEYCGVSERVLAVSDFSQDAVTMFPNPTSNSVNFSFNNADNLNVKMFDLLGRQVMRKSITTSDNVIDVSSLTSGAYLVQITNNESQTITKRLIVE